MASETTVQRHSDLSFNEEVSVSNNCNLHGINLCSSNANNGSGYGLASETTVQRHSGFTFNKEVSVSNNNSYFKSDMCITSLSSNVKSSNSQMEFFSTSNVHYANEINHSSLLPATLFPFQGNYQMESSYTISNCYCDLNTGANTSSMPVYYAPGHEINSYSADVYSTSSCNFQGEESVVANISANDFSAYLSCLSNVINEAIYILYSTSAHVISDN